MKPSEISTESRYNESTFRLVSYLLVSLMFTCAALTLVSLVNRVLPDWQPWYLVILAFFAALDRLYTHRRTSKMPLFSREWAITAGGQWLFIIALVKIVVGLSHGWAAFLAEIPLWRSDLSVNFFNPEFLFILIVILLIRLLSGAFAELLEELGLDQAILLNDVPALQMEKPPARERLLSIIFSLGSVLVVFTALFRVDLRGIFENSSRLVFADLPALAGGGGSTLAYFMLALALLSQSQFMDLHTRWSLQRIPVQRLMAGRWALYSLAFLSLLAAIVSLLPTSYSLGLLATLGYLLDFLWRAVFYIIQAILSLFALLVSLPFLLFGRKPPVEVPTAAPQAPESLPATVNAAAPVAWLEVAKSLAFWTVLVALLAFAVIQYLRQHEEIIQALRRMPGGSLLAKIWGWLRGMFASARSGIAKIAQTGRERLRARRASSKDLFGAGFLNLRRLDPRQKVYLTLGFQGLSDGLMTGHPEFGFQILESKTNLDLFRFRRCRCSGGCGGAGSHQEGEHE